MFDGWCASRNVEPAALPIDRLCNLVYYWLVRNADDKRRADIDAHLHRPPPGADDVGMWSAESEMAAFRSASAATSGRVAS